MITSYGTTPSSFASDEVSDGERMCRLEFNSPMDTPLRYLPSVAWNVAVRTWGGVPSLYRGCDMAMASWRVTYVLFTYANQLTSS